uniref:Uncharacterized protein n=1 Tax=Pavo cristatus TaxID=9049 RepID=A0A8C9FGG2_PAVCR
VCALLLAVQGALQHQLCKLAGIAACLHLEREEAVGAELVGVHRVGAHVGILGALEREASTQHCRLSHLEHVLLPGEGGSVVVDVQHLHLYTVQLQRALDEQLQVEQAGAPCFAHLLPVDPLVHKEDPVLQVHLQVLPRPGPGHNAEPPRRQRGHALRGAIPQAAGLGALRGGEEGDGPGSAARPTRDAALVGLPGKAAGKGGEQRGGSAGRTGDKRRRRVTRGLGPEREQWDRDDSW